MAPKDTRRTPNLAQFRGRSQRAREYRSWLAEWAGVDEATVVRWLAGDELPPDEVIADLAEHHGCSVVHLMNWQDAPRSEIPAQWHEPLAEDVRQRCADIVPSDCQHLVQHIEWRLSAEQDLSEPSADAPRLQRLRMALLEYLATSEEHAEREREREDWRLQWEAGRKAWEAAKEAWRNATPEAKRALVLDALGDEWLTSRALATRITTETMIVDNTLLKPFLARMCEEGHLDRIREPLGSRGRYRYFARSREVN